MRAIACFVATLLLGGGWLLLDGSLANGGPRPLATDDPTTSASPKPSERPSVSPTADSPDDNDCNREVGNFLYGKGFAKQDFYVGESVMDWDTGQLAHTDQAFSSVPLQSETELEGFLSADTPSSVAVRDLRGHDDVSDTGWVAVQFKSPIVYGGNYHWTGTQAVKSEDLMVLAGDVWWMSVDDDCTVSISDSIRAACGNVGFDDISPAATNRD